MQAFLNQGQDISIATGLRVDHAVGVEPDLHETGGEQVPAREAPQDRSFQAGENASREQGGGPGKLGGRAMLDHLVQGS